MMSVAGHEEEEEEVSVKENQSINSAIINGLFEGILEQSEDQKVHSDDEEEEEEDALNISSMSLLTPLAETVAAVVKSPDRKMMVESPSHRVLTGSFGVVLMSVIPSVPLQTSTPATSFIVKSNTPEVPPQPTRFQMSSLVESVSSDSMDSLDQDHKLPYR